MKLLMVRTVNDRNRWYRLELLPNLFGEWLLIRSFGSIGRSRATGIKTEPFDNPLLAQKVFERLVRSKTKKGYIPIRKGGK